MALSDDLIAIRLELKGVREAVSGLHSVDRAQRGIGTSATRAGTAAAGAEKKTSRLSRAYASLGKTARYGIGFLGVGGVFALKAAIDNTEELAKGTAGLTRNLGLNTNVASRWVAVAHARDIDLKSMNMTFTTLSRKMVEAAREGGTAMTSFNMLGVSQDDVIRGSRDMGWGVMRVAQAFGDAEGGARRQAAAQGLLGKGYASVLPLFSEGTKSLKEQLHWADKYGVTLDGKTNDAIMDMVSAQRESRVAMLGLQVALTKALMPAIEGGQQELQRFIETLNRDDLSADQKIARIERQFLRLEDSLIDIITDAIPKVAEHGGELGVKLAAAVWHGFWESDGLGRLFIEFWFFKALGGGALIREQGKKAGLTAGGSFGKWFLLGAIGVGIGLEIADRMSDQSKKAFTRWGLLAGQWFVNAMIDAVEIVYDAIWEKFEPLPGPNPIPEWNPGVNWFDVTPEGSGTHGLGGVPKHLPGAAKRRNYEDLWGQPPPPGPPPWPPPKKFQSRSAASSRLPLASLPRPRVAESPQLPRMNFMGGGGGPRVIQVPVYLDKRQIALAVVETAAADAALS